MKIIEEIIEIDINKIKPDPNRPRTYFDQEDLEEMAKSIITVGIINPIEIDKQFMIITGEQRWLASKMAGLKTIPVKILDINKNRRVMRQVIANVHIDSMSDWDTANALKKLLTISRQVHAIGPTADEEIIWLAEKIGKSRDYIEEKLSILEAQEHYKKAIEAKRAKKANLMNHGQ